MEIKEYCVWQMYRSTAYNVYACTMCTHHVYVSSKFFARTRFTRPKTGFILYHIHTLRYAHTYTHMRSAADNAREHISRLLACWCVCSGYLLWDAGPAHGPGSMPHNGLWTRMPTHSERAIERHTNESGSILETGYHWVQIFVCDGSSAIRLRILVTYSNVTCVKEFCQLSINILKLD